MMDHVNLLNASFYKKAAFLIAVALGLVWVAPQSHSKEATQAPIDQAQTEAETAQDLEFETAIVDAPYVELRTGAGRHFPIFHIIEKNESLALIRQKTAWVRAQTSKGISGWMHESDLAKLMNSDGAFLQSRLEAFQANPANTWKGGVFTGTFDGSDSFSLFGGYHFTKNLSTELFATQTLSDFVETNLFSVQLVHTSLPQSKWNPIVLIGVGKIFINPKSTLVVPENRANDFLKSGIGIRRYLTRGFYIRAEYNAYRQLTDREENVTNDEWKLGISTFLP